MSSQKLPVIVLQSVSSGVTLDRLDYSKPIEIKLLRDGSATVEQAGVLWSGGWCFKGDRIYLSIGKMIVQCVGYLVGSSSTRPPPTCGRCSTHMVPARNADRVMLCPNCGNIATMN